MTREFIICGDCDGFRDDVAGEPCPTCRGTGEVEVDTTEVCDAAD